MREIKFRGKVLWNGSHFFSGDWIEGNLGVKLNIATGEDDYYILDPTYNPNSNSSYFVDILIDAETVGQFTGLPDKNGKEIFEGDIVIWDNELEPNEVYFDETTTQFTTKKRWLWPNLEFVNVIGNIYDNPELLEVVK